MSYLGFDTEELCLFEATKDPVIEDYFTEETTSGCVTALLAVPART